MPACSSAYRVLCLRLHPWAHKSGTTTPLKMQVAAAEAAMGLSGGQMACTMLFGSIILTYLGLEASRLRVLLRVSVRVAAVVLPSDRRRRVRTWESI